LGIQLTRNTKKPRTYEVRIYTNPNSSLNSYYETLRRFVKVRTSGCFHYLYTTTKFPNMRATILFLAFIFTTTIYSQVYSGPESVEWDAANNRWLISNTTSHAILARTQSGTLTTFVPSTTNGPHGIEILGNVLYACCGTSIKGYDLTSGTQVFSIAITGASFLNGLTTDGDSVLYATDFSALDIIRINPTTNKFYKISTNTVSTPNGIIYDGPNNRCVFVNWGTNADIKAIGLNPPYTVSTITATTLDNCDGITQDHLGYYYVADWGSDRLSRFASDFSGGFTSMTSFVLTNPADIDCKFSTIDTIGVPNTSPNTCSFIPLAPPTAAIISTDDTIVCWQGQVTYTNGSSNADSFSWVFGGGNPGTGTTSPINVDYDTLGIFPLQLIATNVYGSDTVNTSILVAAGPAPGISQAGNVLSTTGTFTTYQWYLNGVAISDSISQSITITTGGDYTCEVTDGSGCSGTSNVISSTLSVDNSLAVRTRLFPNPASEILTVEMILEQPQSIQYNVIDMQGKTIRSATEIFQYQGLNYIIINLNGIQNGTYVLKMNSDTQFTTRTFVVNN